MFDRIDIKGIVEWKLRNIHTGEVEQEGRKENLFTRDGKRWWAALSGRPDVLWIGNDLRDIDADGSNFVVNDPTANIGNTQTGNTFNETSGWNRNTLTRVVSFGFLPPTVGTRTTTHIGWKPDYGSSTYQTPVGGRHLSILTALKIDPPIVQSTVQQLEITYTIVYVLPKSITGLQRFKQMGDAAALRRMRRTYIDVNPNSGGSMLLQGSTFPKYWFVDDGAMLVGWYNDNNQRMYPSQWQRSVPSLIWPRLASYSATLTENVADGNGTPPGSYNAAFGVAVFNDDSSARALYSAFTDEVDFSRQDAWAYWPFCFEEGVVGPDVFPKPAASNIATTYMFNQVGIDKTGQGTVDVQGPYQPRSIDPGAPAHWAFRVMNAVSGSVVGAATEGAYMFQRKSWTAYPFGPQPDIGSVPPNAAYQAVDRLMGDTTWGGSAFEFEQRDLEQFDATEGTTDPRGCLRMVYDGIDTFWGLAWRNSQGGAGSHTLWRWRANTIENIFRGANNPNQGTGTDPLLFKTGDDAQTDYRFVDQDGNAIGFSTDFPYAFTTDGAGLVFYGHRDTAVPTGAANPIFVIDNTQPGRWKQRPSGSSDGVDTDRFVVDANDEVHGMFPFVVGDVGKRLRIVDGPNAGLYDVATFVDANNVDLFDAGTVNPANLAADNETTWHWVTVNKLTNHSVGELRHLIFDQANGRLWAVGELGLQVSVDNGATWSALVNEVGGSLPQFPDAQPHQDVRVGATANYCNGSVVVDANGDLYWLSGNDAEVVYLNKLSWNTTGPGGDATFSRLGLTTNFPGANKPTNLSSLTFDIGTDNPNGLGAIWIYADSSITTNTESFYRLTVNAGALAAIDLTEFNPTTFTKLTRHPRWIMTTPGGLSLMAENNGAPQYFYNTRGQGSGVGLDANFVNPGGTIFTDQGNDVGFYQTAFRPDGTFLTTCGDPAFGIFGSFWNNYRWNENTSDWIPWEGTGAEFDAFYGTTNGGLKVPHTDFQELVDNVQVNFTPAGGATADVDEFKEGESYCFIASFGPHRTNVEDFTTAAYASRLGGEYKVESEAVKVASPNTRPVGIYWDYTPGTVTGGSFKSTAALTLLQDANGKRIGWEPNQHEWISGQGDNPDTITGGNNNADMRACIDLGAAPPEIGKLRICMAPSNDGNTLFSVTANQQGFGQPQALYFGASDDGTFGDGVFGGSAEPNAPNLRWDNTTLNLPNGWNFIIGADTTLAVPANPRGVIVEIDLVKLGLTVGERTHRYWQIGYDSGIGNSQNRLFWMEALDPAGNRIGVDSNHRVDEADTDPEFAGVFVDEVHWIQDEPGQAPNNPTTISTGADPSGFVDTVTVDAGTFNTAQIDVVTDYLAWEEPGNVGPGYLRQSANTPGSDTPRGKMGLTNDIDDRASKQAMSKIIAVAAGSIQVRDKIIPANMAGQNWEVRRPIFNGNDYNGRPNQGPLPVQQATNPNGFAYDEENGYFFQQEANETAGRRFRVTRKGVIKIR
jgi:hypothetical protein